MNYITKSGTNSLHGSGFEFYQSQFLSSLENQQKRSVFGFCAPGSKPLQRLRCSRPCRVLWRTATEGHIGGPILKDKVFFFGSTFWDQGPGRRLSRSPCLPYLTPTPAGVQQLQSAFPGSPAIAALAGYGPYSVAAGKPIDNPVPSAASCPSNSTFANGTCLETITGANGVSVDRAVRRSATEHPGPFQ